MTRDCRSEVGFLSPSRKCHKQAPPAAAAAAACVKNKRLCVISSDRAFKSRSFDIFLK